MVNPITLVKLLVKEADSNESCIKCGRTGEGLSSFVFYVFYIDYFTKETMVTGWSFPFCREHIPEEMLKYPADTPVITQEPPSCHEKEDNLFSKKPPPFMPRFIPHAD